MVWRDLKVVGTILELSKLLRSSANVSNTRETPSNGLHTVLALRKAQIRIPKFTKSIFKENCCQETAI